MSTRWVGSVPVVVVSWVVPFFLFEKTVVLQLQSTSRLLRAFLVCALSYVVKSTPGHGICLALSTGFFQVVSPRECVLFQGGSTLWRVELAFLPLLGDPGGQYISNKENEKGRLGNGRRGAIHCAQWDASTPQVGAMNCAPTPTCFSSLRLFEMY